MNKLLLFLFCAACYLFSNHAAAQGTIRREGGTTTDAPVQYDRQGRPMPRTGTGKQDSLAHRDPLADTITIYYRLFDSTRIKRLDSTINDFTTRYPLPAQYYTIGNLGAAAQSYIFTPNLRTGFDPGFHAFDIFRFTIEDTRFYQTTKPYTEIGYLLGSKAEQTVDIVHTQNIKPNFNMAFRYRLINGPGNLQNQNTNHNNVRINGNYQSRNKRYTVYGIYFTNKLQASENGGIQSHSLLKDDAYDDRFLIPTRLIGTENPQRNPFSTKIVTGNAYSEKVFLLRQQYDFGQSDSLIVNDTTVIRLFYPRLRLQHTLTSNTQQFEFRDLYEGSNKLDNYSTYFGKTLPGDSAYYYRDKWKNIQNDFSIISFPEKNNLNQFIKAGVTLENISGTFLDTTRNILGGLQDTFHTDKFHNIFLNGEYRNRTRNQKWDLEATGRFYVNGLNSGDYAVRADLKRYVSKKLGYLEVGFQNVNRSASYIFNNTTSFPVHFTGSLSKENISRISASVSNDAKNTSLTGEYYLVSNYTYFDSFFTAKQEGTLFNVLHVSAKKWFKLSRVLNLYSEVHLQKTTGGAPVNLPLIFTSNRLSFEGVYYKNMFYALGVELRYHTPYKPANYSPFLGQFFYQDNYQINNRPEINAFFHFRIKTFKAFIRFENLNTLGKKTGSVGFNNNNLAAIYYPQPGLWTHVGIWWTFIN